MEIEELLRLISNFYRASLDDNQYYKIKEICDDEEMLSKLDLAALRCLILAVQEKVQKLKKDLHPSFLKKVGRKVRVHEQ
jgi:polyhydroxyalkanoate synthesis regulator phasin